MKSTNFILGCLIGAIIGATTAILLAPVSGADLRGGIKDRTLQIRSEIIQAGAERRAELEDHLANLRKPPLPPATLP
jgi:gas vesicle protein